MKCSILGALKCTFPFPSFAAQDMLKAYKILLLPFQKFLTDSLQPLLLEQVGYFLARVLLSIRALKTLVLVSTSFVHTLPVVAYLHSTLRAGIWEILKI
jgi:hypothetical protein